MNQKSRSKKSYMTFTILLVLFVVFIIETASGGSKNDEVLLKMGAMFKYYVAFFNQWWRLFTAQFLHIGLLHIVSNAIVLYYIGRDLEPVIGHWRFLFLYLLSGIGGNLFSFAFSSDFQISAGASTAIFGLFGAVIALGICNRNDPQISFMARQALVLAIVNLVTDLTDSQIDIQGHLGGLISGFLVAIIIGNSFGKEYTVRTRIIAGLGLVIYTVLLLRIGMRLVF